MWGTGEGQGAFKKGWPGISACASVVSAAGIAGRHGAAVAARGRRRKGTGLPCGPGLPAAEARAARGDTAERGGRWQVGLRVGALTRSWAWR